MGKVRALTEDLKILIEGCRKGKAASQEKLYKRFSAAMYGLCLQYATSEEEAQDILQDGFVKVFTKMDQVNDVKAFPGWVRRIMINTALERYRSSVVLKRVDDEPIQLQDEFVEEDFLSMDAEAIIAMVQELSPKYRMVFNLYAIEGFSHKEIAEKLQISEGTSKSNLSRARMILQEKVKRLYSEKRIR